MLSSIVISQEIDSLPEVEIDELTETELTEAELPEAELAEAEIEEPPLLDIEEMRKRIYGEAAEELMNFSLGDSEVSLFIAGSWKGSLQANFGLSRSPLGYGFAAPETPFLFKQEADLTLSLWINERWFVEANFLDDFAQNTYRAGYQGKPGEFLQYAGIGNTGLDFPSFPYLDLGGDSPSSFGVYSHMTAGNLNFHALFRYDSASREERVFTGNRERTFSYIQPQDTIRGVSYVLPDINIDSDISVYIEDEKGTLTDSGGRRWRLASSSEYAAGKTQGLVELSTRPDGKVAVAYSKSGDSSPWRTSMGSYSTGGFLYETGLWFAALGVNLENYPQSGNGSDMAGRPIPGEIVIGAVTALVVYEPGTFSPFERRNRYDAPSNTSEHAALVRISSGAAIDGFELISLDVSAAVADIPLYITSVSQRSIYELLPQGGGFSPRDPQARWPLSEAYPQIYLPGTGAFTGDINLRFTNLSGTTGYFIGTDVIPGSIQIWRSGIQDTNFNYNSSSGEVILFWGAGYNEVIRITYLKRSEETRLGSIAAGLGAIYQNDARPFSAQGAVGVRWNLTEGPAFTEDGYSSMGTVGLSAKTAWDFDNLKTQITAGLTFEQRDTTGLFRAAGMEGNEAVIPLPPETSFISHPPSSITGLNSSNRADLVFRNYYNNNIAGNTLMPVGWGEAVIVPDLERPYPVKDPQLGDRQTLAAEFTLNRTESWTGFQVPLGYLSEILSRVAEIEIPYRFYGFSGDTSNFRFIIQIGSLSTKDFQIIENPNLIWEKEIFSAGQPFDTNPYIARFSVNETERLRLGDAEYLRLIVIYDGMEEVSGRVILAPPIVRGTSFRAVTYDGDTVRGIGDFSSFNQNHVTAYEIYETGFNTLESTFGGIIGRLHTAEGMQRVLKIEWDNMQSGISAGVDGRTGELPLSDYRRLSFFVKGPEVPIPDGILSFIIAPGPESLLDSRLEAHIPLSAFTAGQWSKVTINYNGSGGVTVDDIRVEGASFRYRPSYTQVDGPGGRSTYMAVFINPGGLSSLQPGSIFIDEIILEDSPLVYRMNAGGAFEYAKRGTLLSFSETSVLSDFLFSTALESEVRTDANQDSGFLGSMFNRTNAEISLLGIKVQGNLLFTAAKDDFLWSADHNVSRNIGIFSFKESFFASPRDYNARHNLNMALSSDLYARFDADALYEFSRLRQKWNLGTGYRSQKSFIPSLAVTAEALWTSKGEISENDGYGQLWARSWQPMIPDAGTYAEARRSSANIVLTQGTKPVGAIITLEGSTNFTGANNLTRSESSFFLDIPVVFSRYSFDLRYGRGFKKHLYFSGIDYYDDSGKFFESLSDSAPFWGVFPVYSLFSPQLNSAMDDSLLYSPSLEFAQYTSFTDHLSTRVNFPAVYSPLAFVIPSTAALRLERLLEQKLDTRSDMLNFGVSVGFSAFNMFGAMGYLPLFKFYQYDEYSHGYETAVIFSDDVTWRIRAALGAGFRGFTGGTFNVANTLTVHSTGNWLESFNASWITPTKRSILSIFYDWAARGISKQRAWAGLASFLNSDYEQLRRESLEFSFNKTGDYLRWSATAGHESIIRIIGRLELTTFFKLRCSEDKYTEVLIFDTLLGTTLRVSF